MKILAFFFLAVAFSPLALHAQYSLPDSLRQEIDVLKTADERVRAIIIDGWSILRDDPGLGLYYTQIAEKDSSEIKSPFLLDSLYRLQAHCYGDMNRRSSTLSSHLKRIKILTSLDSSTNSLASAYFESAHVLKSQGNDSLAIPYFEKCLEVCIEVGYDTQRGQVLMDLANYDYLRGNTDLAIERYEEASSIFEPIERLAFIVGVIKVRLANIFADLGNRELAFKYVSEALLLPDTSNVNFIDYSAETYVGAGQVYLKNKMNRRAIAQYSIAQNLYERHNKFFYLPEVYRDLSIAYKPIDLDSAYTFLEWYVATNDSVLNQKNNEAIAQLRFEFDDIQKQQAIKFLEDEKAIIEENQTLLEADNNRKSYQINLIIGVLVIFGILFFIAFYAFALVRKKNKIVSEQKKIVEDHNKEIHDSIAYAERIQRAVVPESRRFQDLFGESFVMYLPKDVLSGDFYWGYNVTTNDGSKLRLFAVGDCTGHGVPGALLSILGVNYLNLGSVSDNINSTGEALDYLNQGIINTFQNSSETIRDGMDIVIGAIHPESLEMYYSCAKNPIYIVRQKEIIILKGDSKAIGNDASDLSFKFATNTFQLIKNDMIFSMSDGFQDQFGGPNGKKFKIKTLKKLLISNSELPVEEQEKKLHEALVDWMGPTEQIDDITIMGIRV